MNIFNAGAVHLIQNGKGNHQIYAVQSESDSAHFYTVQGEDMASLICECPDTLNGFECKHIFAVRYFNEQRREQAQITEYEEYEANRGCAEDYAEGNRAAHLAESSATYAYAEQLNNEGCVKKLNDHLYSVRDPRIENRSDTRGLFRWCQYQSTSQPVFALGVIETIAVAMKSLSSCYEAAVTITQPCR